MSKTLTYLKHDRDDRCPFTRASDWCLENMSSACEIFHSKAFLRLHCRKGIAQDLNNCPVIISLC